MQHACKWFPAAPGNSFASTSAQVNLIASLVNASGWKSIRKPKGVKRQVDEHTETEERHRKQQKVNEKNTNKRAADTPASSSNVIVRQRCRGKQHDRWADMSIVDRLVEQSNQNKPKTKSCRGRGRPKGVKKDESATKADRSGKAGCLSIWRKVEIIQEYERLKALGTIKNVESFMLKNGMMKGGYQGCLSKTKWLGSREKYKWDTFCKHAPKLAKTVREVPNAVLGVMGVNVSRYNMLETFVELVRFFF